MKARYETILSTIIAACALAVTGMYVYTQAFSPKEEMRSTKPRYERTWDQLGKGQDRLGPASAPVQLVEFGDFQCPFCKTFHGAVRELIAELGDQVSLVYYHFPLPSHPYAEDAAKAAICGADQGAFSGIVDALYERQDSIGKIPWVAYASSGKVADTTRFLACMTADATEQRLEADKALGSELGITATPTVIINGWRFQMPPLADSLKHFAREIIVGRSALVAKD